MSRRLRLCGRSLQTQKRNAVSHNVLCQAFLQESGGEFTQQFLRLGADMQLVGIVQHKFQMHLRLLPFLPLVAVNRQRHMGRHLFPQAPGPLQILLEQRLQLGGAACISAKERRWFMTRSTNARWLARIFGFKAVSFSAAHSCRGSPEGKAALQTSRARASFVSRG